MFAIGMLFCFVEATSCKLYTDLIRICFIALTMRFHYRFMRPNQRHYVLTLGPSLVYGKHFYNAENLLQTCVGMIHTFLADSALTNTDHPDLLYYVPSFLTYWLESYNRQLAAYPDDPMDDG